MPKSRRVRKILLIVAGFVAALGVAAGGTLFYVYDKATAIDRSTPQVVVEQFLDATLILNDADRVSLFVCEHWSAEAALLAVARPTDKRVVVEWGSFSTSIAGASATVVVRVEFSIDAGAVAGNSVRTWTLELANEDGWRVCALTKAALNA